MRKQIQLQRLREKLLLKHSSREKAQTPALGKFRPGLNCEMIRTEIETHPIFNSCKNEHKPFFPLYILDT